VKILGINALNHDAAITMIENGDYIFEQYKEDEDWFIGEDDKH